MQFPLSTKSRETVSQWKKKCSKPLFICGSPGTGKTTLAKHLLEDYHIIHVDSDLHKCKGCFKGFIHDSLYKKDVFMMLQDSNHYKALVIDDLQLFIKYDKGNMSKLLDVLKHNNYNYHPIIVICDYTINKTIKLIRNLSFVIDHRYSLSFYKKIMNTTQIDTWDIHSLQSQIIKGYKDKRYDPTVILEEVFSRDISISDSMRIFSSDHTVVSLNLLENAPSLIYKEDLTDVLHSVYMSLCKGDSTETRYINQYDRVSNYLILMNCVIPYKYIIQRRKPKISYKYNSYISKSLIQIHNQNVLASINRLLFIDDVMCYLFIINLYRLAPSQTLYHWISCIHKVNRIDTKALEKQLKVFTYYYDKELTKNKLTKILKSIV